MLSISWEIPVLTWWRHQMITFSTLLALCAGNSPVTGEFPSQRPVTRSFDAFFHLRLNKSLSKQSWGWWFESPSCSSWRHCIGSRWLDSHTQTWMPHVSIHYSERLGHLKSPEIVLFGEKLICSIINTSWKVPLLAFCQGNPLVTSSHSTNRTFVSDTIWFDWRSHRR